MSIENKSVEEIVQDLENGVRAIFESKKYKRYLEVMSKFHNYSTENWRLIYEQCPNATILAGYVQWKRDFERYVKKGEKAIRIIAPKNKYGFREVCVFDVSQTEGKALPDDGIVVYRLNDSLQNYKHLYNAIVKVSPIPIEFDNLVNLDGVCYHNNKIVINKGMSEQQTLLTMLHEIAHEILHKNSNATKETKEVEAESVAYAVCNYLGIDTSKNSFNYIAWNSNSICNWSNNQPLKTLKDCLDVTTKTTKELIVQIRNELNLCKEAPYAEKDSVQLLYEEGMLYYEGDVVDRDYKKAFDCFILAAKSGHEDAIFKVAVCFEEGYGVTKNCGKALQWFRKICDNKYAQNRIGYYYDHGLVVKQNQLEAYKWFLKAAEQGLAVAQSNVGMYLKYGYGHVKKDTKKANEWFLKAASQGHNVGQYHLGLSYKYGYGLVQNEKEAYGWLLKAAEQGNLDAKYEIAKCYEDGLGVHKNLEEAFEIYTSLSDGAYEGLRYRLARFYLEGLVVERDITKGVDLLLKAVADGDKNAKQQIIDAFIMLKAYDKGKEDVKDKINNHLFEIFK